MKNVDKIYKNYYNAYRSDYDTDDELKEDKRKILTTNSLNQTMKKQKSEIWMK